MEIKTIILNADYAEKFDNKVNTALADGWELVRREVIIAQTEKQCTGLYAELAKLPEPEEAPAPSWCDALRTIRDECENAAECSATGCAMHAWCQEYLSICPTRWTWDEEAEA